MPDYSNCAVNQGYTKTCRDSIGGIKTVYLVEVSAKNTLTTSSGNVSAFTLNSGKKFYAYELEQAVGTASVDPQPAAANGSLFYNHVLNITVPKRSASFNYHLRNLAVNDLMAIVLDQNGDYWLIGYNNGLKLQPSTGPFGTAMGDLNGYQLAFLAMEGDTEYKVPANMIASLLVAA